MLNYGKATWGRNLVWFTKARGEKVIFAFVLMNNLRNQSNKWTLCMWCKSLWVMILAFDICAVHFAAANVPYSDKSETLQWSLLQEIKRFRNKIYNIWWKEGVAANALLGHPGDKTKTNCGLMWANLKENGGGYVEYVISSPWDLVSTLALDTLQHWSRALTNENNKDACDTFTGNIWYRAVTENRLILTI